MGQYQQWLQYQEIHKHLSTQVEALEAELAQLQDCRAVGASSQDSIIC